MFLKLFAHIIARYLALFLQIFGLLLAATSPGFSRRNTGPGIRRCITSLAILAIVCLCCPIGSAFAEPAGAGASQVASGELDVIIKENFKTGQYKMDYFLRDGSSSQYHQLVFEREPSARLRTGQRVTVRGHAEGRRMAVETLEEERGIEPLPVESLSDAATDERPAVVLMVDLLDAKASTRYTLDQIATTMYTGDPSVDKLYREASRDRLTFPADTDGDGGPDVFGPFTINYNSQTCKYYDWAHAAEHAAQAAGIHLSDYRHRIFVLPRHNDLPQCGWGGIANVGCGSYCRAWIAEGESGMVYAHELGHNLNMAHAGTDPENDGQINNSYGDASDPMGKSRSWHVFNASHIDQMGWYAAYPGSIATVLASGIFDITAIGTDPATSGAPLMLKIARPNGDYLYLSYRQPTGYDASLSSTYTRGVNVHRYKGTGYGATSFIASLTDLGSFYDVGNGITVTQLGRSGDQATVEIGFGCASALPTVNLSPASNTVRPGATATYTVAVTNNDGSGCAPTTFEQTYTGQPIGVLSALSLTLAAGASGSTTLQVTPAGLADADYSLEVRATDMDGAEPQHANPGVGTAAIMVDGTAPSVPTGLSALARGNRVHRVRLRWTGSTDNASGVASYTVYRNGSAIGETTRTRYTDSTAVGGVTTYTVAAKDQAGNLSVPSAGATVTVKVLID